jgi:hypothetical protein
MASQVEDSDKICSDFSKELISFTQDSNFKLN